MDEKTRMPMSARKDAFARIAFWQFMAFTFLLVFAWANAILDFPSIVFGTQRLPFDLYRTCMMTAGIMAAAVVTVGHTYEQQKVLLKQYLVACPYCNRVQVNADNWTHAEEYFMEHSPIPVTKTACPSCEKMLTELHEHTKSDPLQADAPRELNAD